MASIRKRGDTWRAEVRRDEFYRSESFPTKALAVAWATKTEALFLEGKKNLPSTATLPDAFERYAIEVSPLKKGARWEIVRLAKFGRDPALQGFTRDASPAQIAQWRDRRLQEVSEPSVRRELGLLGAVLEKARREWGWIQVNPCKDVTKPKSAPARNRRIDDDEIALMLKALKWEEGRADTKQHLTAIAFLVALETAMRASEILSLTPGTISLDRRFVSLSDTKNGSSRDVPLTLRAVELLRTVEHRSPCFDLSASVLDMTFRRARKTTPIRDLTFHDTRHEACTRLAKKVTVLELARILGHRDLKSLMIYFNPTAEELAGKI